jgi:hypothetical protein
MAIRVPKKKTEEKNNDFSSVDNAIPEDDILDDLGFEFKSRILNIIEGIGSEALEYSNIYDYVQDFTGGDKEDVEAHLAGALYILGKVGVPEEAIADLLEDEDEEAYWEACEVIYDHLHQTTTPLPPVVNKTTLDEFIGIDIDDIELDNGELEIDGVGEVILDWFVTKSEKDCKAHAEKVNKEQGTNLTCETIITTRLGGKDNKTAEEAFEAHDKTKLAEYKEKWEAGEYKRTKKLNKKSSKAKKLKAVWAKMKELKEEAKKAKTQNQGKKKRSSSNVL